MLLGRAWLQRHHPPPPPPPPTPAPANLAGTWDGRWVSNRGGGSGTFVATLSQSGSALSGTVSVTGMAPCQAQGPREFFGSVTGSNFAFGVMIDEEFNIFAVVFRGTVNPPGTSGSGTYLFCTFLTSSQDTGTFSMTRR